MTKDLQEKAINIKGKQYVLVSDRILYFNETYPNGTIETQLVSDPGADMVIIRACVTPDIDKETRFFTGYSQAVKGQGLVNTTAALENAETSAVGRALAMMGIGVIDSVASVDEIHKATVDQPSKKEYVSPYNNTKMATPKQLGMIHAVAHQKGEDVEEIKSRLGITSGKDMTMQQASKEIERLLALPDAIFTKPTSSAEDSIPDPTEEF